MLRKWSGGQSWLNPKTANKEMRTTNRHEFYYNARPHIERIYANET